MQNQEDRLLGLDALHQAANGGRDNVIITASLCDSGDVQSIPRPEYPRPQFVRVGWLNLNGQWAFEVDAGCSGRARGLHQQEKLSDQILVPFCPESPLSGINKKDFLRCVWYKRTFKLPHEAMSKRVLLHFGAVDYACEAWVNGQSVGTHRGGYASFSFDITSALHEGDNIITVCAEDDPHSPKQPRGKQSTRFSSYECFYTRTTGIWQTVWLEWMNQTCVEQIALTPDALSGKLHIRAKIRGGHGSVLKAFTSYQGVDTGVAEGIVNGNYIQMTVALSQTHLWSVGKGRLYDLHLTLCIDDVVIDSIDSYFGLRSVGFDGMKFLLNGKPVFQRLVLDQGFYPDGIYTAPSDLALRQDIEMSMLMGFNGARLHEKVFEARYLYWADRLGYLCWGEMGNWGLDHSDIGSLAGFEQEWLEVVARDYSAPSIIGWCPFNETWDYMGKPQNDEVLRTIYRVTKALDPTRPVIDTSGNYHVESDIHDVHDYEQNPEEFSRRYGHGTKPIYERFSSRQLRKEGQPVFVSEFGGIRWTRDLEGWGYGDAPQTEQAFLTRYSGLVTTLLNNPDHFAFCYTQLTDVEQEQNGLYTYDRKPKFNVSVIRQINTQPAAMEKEVNF